MEFPALRLRTHGLCGHRKLGLGKRRLTLQAEIHGCDTTGVPSGAPCVWPRRVSAVEHMAPDLALERRRPLAFQSVKKGRIVDHRSADRLDVRAVAQLVDNGQHLVDVTFSDQLRRCSPTQLSVAGEEPQAGLPWLVEPAKLLN